MGGNLSQRERERERQRETEIQRERETERDRESGDRLFLISKVSYQQGLSSARFLIRVVSY